MTPASDAAGSGPPGTEELAQLLGLPLLTSRATPLGEPWSSRVWCVELTLADGSQRRIVAKGPREGRGMGALYRRELAFYRALGRYPEGCLGRCLPRAMGLRDPADPNDEEGAGFLLLLSHCPGRHPAAGLDRPQAERVLTALASIHAAFWRTADPGQPPAAARPSAPDAMLHLPERRFEPALATRLCAVLAPDFARIQTRFPGPVAHLPDPEALGQGLAALAPRTLCHLDLHAQNVLLDGEEVYFLDWQNACWGPPAMDVAHLVGGSVRPAVQAVATDALLAHYRNALTHAGGPALDPRAHERDVATCVQMLWLWNARYLAQVSDEEADGRSMLRAHWARISTAMAGIASLADG